MIPSVAHFIWFGEHFPWVNELAIRSALRRGGFQRAILHHDGRIPEQRLDPLCSIEGFEAREIEPEQLLRPLPFGAELFAIFKGLVKPNARANVIRAAVLYAEGGVYLDMDTITVRAFTPLLEVPAFCGEERVVWPVEVKKSRHPSVLAQALLQDGLRFLCASLPGGWRAFRVVESFYPRAVNNAVLGAQKGHPFVARLLRAMVEVPPERRLLPFALGTHLLQQELAGWDQRECEVYVHPPEIFYPLGPVVSHHWFRRGRGQALSEVLAPETRLVHWYASVRNRHLVSAIDPTYVQRRATRELFSALVCEYVA